MSGFTIVEILIVIVVIAILAAISVVAYNGIQTRTHTSVVKSDLSQMSKSMEIYNIDNGSYIHDLDAAVDENAVSPVISAAIQAMPQKVSTGSYSTATSNLLYISNTTGSKWVLLGVPKRGETWYVSNEQLTPVLHTTLSSQPLYYPYPGSSFRAVARVFDIPANEANFWNVYKTGTDANSGFRAWN